MRHTDEESSKRGQRDSPRTPAPDESKLAKLRDISTKLSPKPNVPPLPGAGQASGSATQHDISTPAVNASEIQQTPGMQERPKDKKKNEEDSEGSEEIRVMMNRMMGMLGTLSVDMQSVKSGMAETSAKAQKAVDIAEKTEAQVKEMQSSMVTKEMVQDMINKSISDKIDQNPGSIGSEKKAMTTGPDYRRLIVGGLSGSSFEAAKIWAKGILEQNRAPKPVDIYAKGDYKGFIFLRFSTPLDAKDALTAIKDDLSKNSSNTAWCNYDLPIEERVTNSFLFGLKAQLVKWKLSKKYMRVDTENNVFAAGGKDVVRASVVGDTFVVEWIAAEWAQWTELQQSAELGGIIAGAKEKLAKSRNETSKGAGKGPP
jgi:hypothetical protein